MFSGIATLRKICNHPDLVGIKEKAQVSKNCCQDLHVTHKFPTTIYTYTGSFSPYRVVMTNHLI